MKITANDSWKLSDGTYRCPFCSKTYSKMGISTHVWRSHGDGKKHDPNIGYKTKSRVVWNKGRTKTTDSRVRQYGETYSKLLTNGGVKPSFLGKHHSPSARLKISEKLSKNNHGGRCKWFEYTKPNGVVVKLQGTWEVRFARVLDLLDEDWIKPGTSNKQYSFKWTDNNGQIHYYTPDFYSPKLKKFFEVKGYWWGNDIIKMQRVIEQNPTLLIEVIQKRELLVYEKLIGTMV